MANSRTNEGIAADSRMKKAVIPYGRQSINKADIRAVLNVLKSDWLTQGPKIAEFETALAKYCGAKYAVVVSSGTAALHLACLALQLGPSDKLITSTNSFVASANCGIYCGAKPELVDIELGTYNLDPGALQKHLRTSDLEQDIKRVVIPVHFAGHPCKMRDIARLSKEYNFYTIEDASHALGSSYFSGRDQIRVGCCRHSDMTVFSFHPVKTITCGEGGAILTNRSKLYRKLKMLRSHGIVRAENSSRIKASGKWFYEMNSLGYNYRITDLQCALGLQQLKRINMFIEKRNRLARLYNKALARFDNLVLPELPENGVSAFHLYVVRIISQGGATVRKKIFQFMRNENIAVQIHYIPIHYHPYYQDNYQFGKGLFPRAEEYYDSALSLPIFHDLSKQQVDRVVQTLSRGLKKYGLMQ